MARRVSIDNNQNLQDLGQTLKSGYHAHEVFLLPVAKLRPSKQQPRRESETRNLDALRASIERYGLLQPITVHPSGEGDTYDVVSGHRRLLAFQQLGRETIPAIIRQHASDRELFELAVMENENREDLDPIERVYAVIGLIQRYLEVPDNAMEQAVVELRAKARQDPEQPQVQEIDRLLRAVGVGNINSFYANHLRLLRLPGEVLLLVRDYKLAPGAALQLLPLVKYPDALLHLAHQAAKEGTTVRDLRARVEEQLGELNRNRQRGRDERGRRYEEHALRMTRGLRVLKRELTMLESTSRPDLNDDTILSELETVNQQLEKLLRLLKR